MENNIETWRIQVFVFIGVIFFLYLIVALIKRRRLREEYSILWLFFGVLVGVIAIWRNSLVILSKLLGVAYAPAALFIVIIGAHILLSLHFSLVISSHKEKINSLIQEIGLLREEISKGLKNMGDSKK